MSEVSLTICRVVVRQCEERTSQKKLEQKTENLS